MKTAGLLFPGVRPVRALTGISFFRGKGNRLTSERLVANSGSQPATQGYPHGE